MQSDDHQDGESGDEGNSVDLVGGSRIDYGINFVAEKIQRTQGTKRLNVVSE